MLYRFLFQQFLSVSEVTGETCFERRTDDIVEQEGAVNEEREAEDLEPLEGFPSQDQGNEPDE